MAAGNDSRRTRAIQYVNSTMANSNSFLVAGGWRILNLYNDCTANPKTCEPTLALYVPPLPPPYQHVGSTWCGERAKNMCILSPWTTLTPGSDGYSTGALDGGGTSISTPYAGGVTWLVSSALKYLYKWQGGITQKQAMMMASAIIKSCAIDLGETGPDAKTGLGLLYVGCMEEGDGLVKDPTKLMKDEYKFPSLYTFPSIKTTTQTIVTVSTTSSTQVVSRQTTTTNSVIDNEGVETRTLETTTILEITTTVTTSTLIISPDGTQTTRQEQRNYVTNRVIRTTAIKKICPKGKENLCGLRIRAKVFLESTLQ